MKLFDRNKHIIFLIVIIISIFTISCSTPAVSKITSEITQPPQTTVLPTTTVASETIAETTVPETKPVVFLTILMKK